MIKILSPDFKFEDERGTLTQLVRSGYNQINVIQSKAGALRGGHFHKLNNEAFYIIQGKLEVTAKQGNKSENYFFGTGDMFLISPDVVHDFRFIEDTLLVSMYDKGVELEDGYKDIYKEECI